ncbi:MAG: CpaF family protein [Candidatus Goldiibacteriota bacterium]|jgi:pilus assembly protein CpaF
MKKVITIMNLRDGAGRTTLALSIASAICRETGGRTILFEQGEGVFDAPAYSGAGEGRIFSPARPAKDYFDSRLGFGLVCGNNPAGVLKHFDGLADIIIIDSSGPVDMEILGITNFFLIPALMRSEYIKRVNYITAMLRALNYPSACAAAVVNREEGCILSGEELAGVLNGAEIISIIPESAAAAAAAEKGELCALTGKKDKYCAAVSGLARRLLETQGKAAEKYIEKAAPEPFYRPLPLSRGSFKELKKNVRMKVLGELDINNMEKDALIHPAKKAAIYGDIKKNIRGLLDLEPGAPETAGERDVLLGEIFDEVAGLGAIERFLADPLISEVMVNGPDDIYVESAGRLHKTGASYTDDTGVMRAIERIVFPLGRRIDESSPYVDARLPDGSRVNAVIPPLALNGPVVTIRKFSKNKMTAADLVKCGSLSAEAAAYLEEAVRGRSNILISGGTGSGKTTLLNVLSSFIPEDERIITIEDSAELKLNQEHVVRLEARPPNIEGAGAVTIRDLVKNCLRMRPDRIIVGECRAGETLDMLQAMNTGHDGSMTTVHSNSPRDALSRLEVMSLMAGIDLPVKALREQIKGAVNLIIQQARFKDGSRRVTHITKITGMDNDSILMHDIFRFGSGISAGLERSDII